MNYTIAGLIFLLIVSCQSSTNSTTQSRQPMTEEEQATIESLVQAYDLLLLNEHLSEVAMDEASLRNTYLLAGEAQSFSNQYMKSLRKEAKERNIALPDSVSDDHLNFLRELQKATNDELDAIYYRSIIGNLSDIIDYSDNYLQYGEDERLKNLSEKLKKEGSDLKERFESSNTF